MSARFAALSPRERLMLLMAALAIAVFLLFQFGYAPLRDWRGAARRDHEASAQLLAEMMEKAGRLKALRQRFAVGAPSTPTLLRQAISSAAQARGIALTRLTPEDDGSVSVTIDAVESETLFGWLLALYEEKGVAVARAGIAGEPANRTLRVQLRFSGRGDS